MKIALIILSIVFGLLILLCILPLTVDLSFCDGLVLKIRYSGITVFDNAKRVKYKKKEKTKKKSVPKTDETTPKKENFFKKTYRQKGLLGTVMYFSSILNMLLKKMCWVVRRFKFRKFKLDISVATNDAADTAIQYGKICGAVYPVISFFESNTDFKAREININADFDKTKSEFKTSVSVTTRIFFWLVAAICVLFEFLKLQRKESEKYERK